MKYFAIILAVFTLVLSGIPCDDEVVAGSEITVLTSAHENDSDVHLDMCTPFDSCDCCTTPISVTEIFTAKIAPEIIPSKICTATITSFSKDFTNGIFQPPQV